MLRRAPPLIALPLVALVGPLAVVVLGAAACAPDVPADNDVADAAPPPDEVDCEDGGCSLDAGSASDAGETCEGCEGCGDGLVAFAEPCDDGNRADGDGCSSRCVVEPGFRCAGEPSTCTSGCGDGRVVAPEQCDDGAWTPGDGCSTDCRVEAGFTCAGAPSTCTTTCGDGIRAGLERCDDGNTSDGDACTAQCTFPPGSTRCLITVPWCHNALVPPEPREDAYDGANANADRCMLRAADYENYCANNPAYVQIRGATTARFEESGVVVRTHIANADGCIIHMPAGCDNGNSSGLTWFHDSWNNSNTDPEVCKRRAMDWWAYCGNQPSHRAYAAFWRAGQAIAYSVAP